MRFLEAFEYYGFSLISLLHEIASERQEAENGGS